MKLLKLFHSYNYVNGTYTILNNKIYNRNNNKLFTLLNIPDCSNNNLYKIKIENILVKKKYSMKKIQNFYSKHNVKIFLIVNYTELFNLINSKKHIPDFTLLLKILQNNLIKKINKNTPLIDSICINNTLKKNINLIFNTNTINLTNTYKIHDLIVDFRNKSISISNVTPKLSIEYIIEGCIFLCDIRELAIKELCTDYINIKFNDKFNKQNNNDKILIITNDIPLWETYICKNGNIILLDYNKYNYDKNKEYTKIIDNYYSKIIIDLYPLYNLNNLNNLNNFLKKLHYKSIVTLIDNINTITFYNILLILKTIYNNSQDNNYNNNYIENYIDNNYIDEGVCHKIVRVLFIRNYLHILTKKGIIKNIKLKKLTNKYPLYNFELFNNIEHKLVKTNCSICYKLFTKNNLCRTECSHYFCKRCIDTLLNNSNKYYHCKFICPLCRNIVSKITKLEPSIKNILNKNNINQIDTRFIYIVENIKNIKNINNIVITIDKTLLKNLRKTLVFLNKPNINLVLFKNFNLDYLKKIKLKGKHQIYFLEDYSSYDMNAIFRMFYKANLVKYNINFMSN